MIFWSLWSIAVCSAVSMLGYKEKQLTDAEWAEWFDYVEKGGYE